MNYGLSQQEAEERLKKFGPNIYWKKRQFPWLRFFKEQVFNYFNIVLFIAVLISFWGGGSEIESLLIFIFLLLAIGVALWSEIKFHQLYQKLIKYLSKNITVIRDGKEKVIKAEYLVPGDLVYLTKGEIIPADLKVIKAIDLLVDESVLTGEIKPVEKKENEILYSGTKIIEGEVEAEVIATGEKTRFARIHKLTLETEKQGAYRKEMERFTQDLVKMVLLFMFIVFFVNVFRYPNFQELLVFSLALTISIIPEHLPAIEITALMIYTHLFSKRKVITKRLSAIEDLALIDVLCVDKTGTITTNNLEVEKIETKNENLFLELALSLTFGLSQRYLSDFERALEKYAEEKNIKLSKNNLISRKLFDPKLRISQAFIEKENQKYLVVIGAPEYLVNYCSLKEEEKNNWLEKFKDYSEKGFRTYALAYKPIYQFDQEKVDFIEKDKKINDLNFLGFAIFRDELKPKIKEIFEKAKELGIEIKILTGDRAEVAKSVALKAGLIKEDEKVWREEELMELSEEEFKKVVEENKIFARLSPESKYKIVKVLKEKHFVGFLGEGINDLPVLQLANVSLVVDSAVDAAKDIADVILLEKSLAVILDGIILGRKAFFNTLKYLKHVMVGNLGNFFSVGFLSFFVRFTPLTALLIIITDTLTDLPFFAGVIDNVDEKEIKKPKLYETKQLFKIIISLGAFTALFNLFVFMLFKNNPPEVLRTILFLQVTFSGLLIFYSIRTNFFFFQSKSSFVVNLFILVAILLTFLPVHSILGKFIDLANLPVKISFSILALNFLYLLFVDILKIIVLKKI